ncbi:MAG: tryptophan-rich sensory protein [Methanomicrobiales archaeon]|nr:tryptophan-rich sensory protein [Methanomicrobiales archaeon]NQS73090.1 tryptophan-rich sensory protein [Methanoculleus sp.]
MASASVRVTQFLAAIVVCLLAGLIGSIFTAPAVPTWYATLTKPALTPPAWLFGPVWTVLFILMGIALYLVWRKGWEQKDVQVATAIFAVQLALNVLWSYFFFGLQVPFLALIEIVLLWVAVCITIGAFYRVSIPATALLLPYLLWVTFAAYLTYGIYTLNPL